MLPFTSPTLDNTPYQKLYKPIITTHQQVCVASKYVVPLFGHKNYNQYWRYVNKV